VGSRDWAFRVVHCNRSRLPAGDQEPLKMKVALAPPPSVSALSACRAGVAGGARQQFLVELLHDVRLAALLLRT
jgi:hypothetical protein